MKTKNKCFIKNKNVVKAFYTAGMLLEVCSTFGELNEEIAQQKNMQNGELRIFTIV